jgi:hypothetical protein
VNFTIFHFFRKNEKTPETLDFTGFSGGVFGVPEVIRTPDLPLRSRPDTMKPSATQCKKILGNTRLFTVSNPIWYYAS